MKLTMPLNVPDRITALPKDARGLPIPYLVFIDSQGIPDFRIIDPKKTAHALKNHLCGLCGIKMGGHIAFVGGPNSIKSQMFTDAPMHRDCATFALKTCPFLAAPNFAYSRKVPDNTLVNESVSTERPDVFGLGICKGFELVRMPAGHIIMRAKHFDTIQWWKNGHVIEEQLSS